LQTKSEGGINNSHLKHWNLSIYLIMHRKNKQFRKIVRNATENVPAHCRGTGLGDLLRSPPTQSILWFYRLSLYFPD